MLIRRTPFQGSEGDWNHQVDLLVCFLEFATWVHEMSGHGERAARQRWAESRYISLTPPEAMPVRTVLATNKITRDCSALDLCTLVPNQISETEFWVK